MTDKIGGEMHYELLELGTSEDDRMTDYRSFELG
jgi:hypothetical protein